MIIIQHISIEHRAFYKVLSWDLYYSYCLSMTYIYLLTTAKYTLSQMITTYYLTTSFNNNSYINYDFALLKQLLKANKISSNVTKTEIVIFRSKYKSIIKHMNFIISSQRVHLSSKVRYLGVTLQENFGLEQILIL